MSRKCPFVAASLYQPALCLISRHLADVCRTDVTAKCAQALNTHFDWKVSTQIYSVNVSDRGNAVTMKTGCFNQMLQSGPNMP